MSNSNINTYPVPAQFLPNAPYNAANNSTRDTHKLWDQKNCSPNKTMWLIAFAGELGDGNSIAETHKQDGGGGTSVVTKLPQWTTTPDIMKRNKTLRFTNLNRILQTLPRCELSTQLNGTSQSNLWMRKQFARPLRKRLGWKYLLQS